jgi:hypothetical protein
VIGCDSDVRGATTDHPQHRRQDTANGRDFPALLVPGGWQRIVVPEQLVCAVDQMDFQSATPLPPYRSGRNSINSKVDSMSLPTNAKHDDGDRAKAREHQQATADFT